VGGFWCSICTCSLDVTSLNFDELLCQASSLYSFRFSLIVKATWAIGMHWSVTHQPNETLCGVPLESCQEFYASESGSKCLTESILPVESNRTTWYPQTAECIMCR
jgi:hypothetical protein